MRASMLRAERETGPGPPVELRELREFAQGTISGAAASGPVKKNGARPCESNDATPLKASHLTQELISD